MTFLEISLSIAVLFLTLVCSFSIYFNVKHGLLILKFIDSIESTLDVMDERYSTISEILQIPLFYDSPQIRQVLNDVDACRESILASARILSDMSLQLEEKEEE